MKNEQEIRNTLITKAGEDAEFTDKLSEPEMEAIAGGSHCNADVAEEIPTESTRWKP